MDEEKRNFSLLRNLKDAGCDRMMIEKFVQLDHAGKTAEELRLLSVHRTALLKKIHDYQKRIDCLDYLIYGIRKKYETPI